MGKVIYPIRKAGVYCLTKDVAEILQKNPAVSSHLQSKLQFLFKLQNNAKVSALKEALELFEKPISLEHVRQKRNSTMQEV